MAETSEADLVEVKCNLCDTDDPMYICHVNSYCLVKCKQCGLYYLNPRPSTDALNNLYATYYPPTTDLQKRSEELWGPETTWTWASMDMFADVVQTCKKFNPSGRLLDVGCGYGFFLQLATKSGYSGIGVELSELAARYAQEVLRLNVLNRRLKEARFPDRSFDIVTMNGVIEHLEDPSDALRETNRILDFDGLCALTTPNVIFGLPLIVVHKLLRGDMVQAGTIKTAIFDAPRHLYFFSPTTLSNLLEKAGFEVLCVRNGVPIKNPNTMWNIIKQLSWRFSSLISFASGGSLLAANSIAIFARKKSEVG